MYIILKAGWNALKVTTRIAKYGSTLCLHIDFAMQYEVIDNEEGKNAKSLTPIMQCESPSQYGKSDLERLVCSRIRELRRVEL
jgi:hypothetical protein